MGVGCVWVLVALLECSAFIESFRLNSFYIDAFSDVTSSGFPPKRSSFQFLPLENSFKHFNPKRNAELASKQNPLQSDTSAISPILSTSEVLDSCITLNIFWSEES